MHEMRLEVFTGLHSVKLIIENVVKVARPGYLVSIHIACSAQRSRAQVHLFILLPSNNDSLIAFLVSTKHRAKLPRQV